MDQYLKPTEEKADTGSTVDVEACRTGCPNYGLRLFPLVGLPDRQAPTIQDRTASVHAKHRPDSTNSLHPFVRDIEGMKCALASIHIIFK